MNVDDKAGIVKLRLKTNDAEIEYEGNEQFLKVNLLEVFQDVLNANPTEHETQNAEPQTVESQERPVPHLAINSIASILEVDSGTGLIVAAAAHLDLVQGKDKFTRSELRQEIRNATRFFKTSYASNLTSYIGNLVKSEQLHEIGQDTYALPEARRSELKAQLDEHR